MYKMGVYKKIEFKVLQRGKGVIGILGIRSELVEGVERVE